jgi:quinol monooxygenase YgiN
MPDSKLYVVARLIARPDRVEETRALLTGLLEPTRKENGCIRYDLFQNQDDPTDFTFIEEWTDKGCLDAHLAGPHIQAALTKLPDLLAADPAINLYNPVV